MSASILTMSLCSAFGLDDGHRSEDGGDADSMTPSQSASQAMSRSSSYSDEEDQIDYGAVGGGQAIQRKQGTRSPRATSPSRAQQRSVSPARAFSPIPNGAPPGRVVSPPPVARAPTATTRAPTARPAPSIGPIPTAPRPVSSYTLGNAGDTLAPEAAGGGIPGFEIPKAPVNVASRRPTDDSSDEEDDRQYQVHSNGIPAGQRNSHYPYDAPASPSARGGSRLRRTHSDDSSVRGGGTGSRKRRGSFFGGLASLFKRKDKNNVIDDRDSDLGRGSPLRSSGAKWETRTDRNVFAAQRAGGVGGVTGGRFRRGDDSSDDEGMPKNVVKVVNDPAKRIKALSDLGRASSSAPMQPTTIRAASVMGGTGSVKKKKTRRAASDIGVSTADITASLLPPAAPVPRSAVVPVKPTLTRNTSHASAATGTSKIKKKSKSAAPAVPEEEIVQQDDTPSVKAKTKKKKATSSSEPPRTLVLSAESLGIPTTAGARAHTASGTATPVKPPGLSRSNTVTSHATATTTGTVTVKKKKKRAVGAAAEKEAQPVAIPTAADLASSLPSATSTYNPLTAPLPLPADTIPASAGSKTSQAQPQAQATEIAAPTTGAAGKVPKTVAAGEKRSKRDGALYGTNDWVSHGGTTHAAAAGKTANKPVKRDVAEGEDSLMTIMDRVEGGEDRTPSRKYGTKVGGAQDDLAAVSNGLAVPRTPNANANTVGALTKRKSVRLADPSEQQQGQDSTGPAAGLHVPPGSMSPASSVRSADLTLTPSKGIIKNASPAPVSASAGLPTTGSEWNTRRAARGGAGELDSSDESDEDEEYRKARKAFAKRAKGMDEVMGGTFTAAEKGKGRAAAVA